MKKVIFCSLIIIEIIIVYFLGIKIFTRSKNILGKTSFNPINKKTISFNQVDSLKYFYEPKPNVTEFVQPSWLLEKAHYSLNKDGLNERYDYSVKKDLDTFRIITLGDSFTFGQYINTKDNWTELLEDKLNKQLNCKNYKKIEVINLGVYAYDIRYSVERYKIRGQKYDPNLIIWMLIEPTRIDENIFGLLKCKNDPTNNNLPDVFDCEEKWETALEQLQSEGKQNKDYTDKILIKNFNYIFDFYNKEIITVDINESHTDILKMISQPKKIHIFNFKFGYDKNLILPDFHPNKKGHQKIAEDVFNYVIKNKLIPCN